MAIKNKVIRNSKTGQDIKFLQTAKDTNGALLEMESTYNAFSKEPVAHYHPYQQEDFSVTEGELTVKMDGKIYVLKPGEKLHIPAGKHHAMWNNTQGKTVVNWQVRPAMNTEYLLETSTGLANEPGKTNEQGMPNILQLSLMASRYSNVFRMTKPPFVVQKILFTLLKPIGYIAGYKGSYKKYAD